MTPPATHRRPLVIGLIGGIGSGKSAVAAAFAERGGRVITADTLGHEALRQPTILQEVVRHWGDGVLDASGQVDRKALARIVFADPAALTQLESLSHPWIRRRIEEEIQRAQREDVPLVVLDAALLLEAGWHAVCDRLVFVDASDEVRRERVTRGRGWASQQWQARESAQLPLTEKRGRADHVVDNSSTLEHLGRQIDDLLCRWGITPGPAAAGNGLTRMALEDSRT